VNVNSTVLPVPYKRPTGTKKRRPTSYTTGRNVADGVSTGTLSVITLDLTTIPNWGIFSRNANAWSLHTL